MSAFSKPLYGLNLGGSVYDPTDPVGRLLFNVLAMIAEIEADPLRAREGIKIAKAKGRPRGKQPKLSPRQEAHLVEPHRQGQHTSADPAELSRVARSTVYRALQRAGDEAPAADAAYGSRSAGNRSYAERLALVPHRDAESASMTCHRRAERQVSSRRARSASLLPFDCRDSAAGLSAPLLLPRSGSAATRMAG